MTVLCKVITLWMEEVTNYKKDKRHNEDSGG